jgi:hypothetical protein
MQAWKPGTRLHCTNAKCHELDDGCYYSGWSGVRLTRKVLAEGLIKCAKDNGGTVVWERWDGKEWQVIGRCPIEEVNTDGSVL